MSLLTFPDSKDVLSQNEALISVITSIAMEEAALSHVINAEGEKIQYILEAAKRKRISVCDVLRVNESVADVLGKATDMQLILKSKLQETLKHLPKTKPSSTPEPAPKPPCPKSKPPAPQPQPKPPCSPSPQIFHPAVHHHHCKSRCRCQSCCRCQSKQHPLCQQF